MNKSNLFFAILLAISLFSCKKNKDTATAFNNDDFVKFKINGTLVQTSAWNASYGKLVGNMITCNITSNMHQDKRTININVNAVTPGTYPLGLNNALLPQKGGGIYYPNYNNAFETYDFISGTFTITQIDTIQKIYAGRFEGTLKDSNTGTEYAVTEGEFRSKNLKKFWFFRHFSDYRKETKILFLKWSKFLNP
jgi:hypothetical protein